MINQVVVQNQNSIVPPVEANANDEIDRISHEFQMSDLIREVGRFRIWRMKSTSLWKQVTEDGTNVTKYETWEQFIADMSKILQCGRTHLFDRMRIYDQMKWLGYTEEEMLTMMARRPSLYHRFLQKAIDWDTKNQTPMAVKIPETKGMSENDTKNHIRGIMNRLESFDAPNEALKYVSESVLVESQVEIIYDGDVLKCVYYNQEQDNNGQTQVVDYDETWFYPNKDVPEWVREKLESAFKRIRNA